MDSIRQISISQMAIVSTGNQMMSREEGTIETGPIYLLTNDSPLDSWLGKLTCLMRLKRVYSICSAAVSVAMHFVGGPWAELIQFCLQRSRAYWIGKGVNFIIIFCYMQIFHRYMHSCFGYYREGKRRSLWLVEHNPSYFGTIEGKQQHQQQQRFYKGVEPNSEMVVVIIVRWGMFLQLLQSRQSLGDDRETNY